MRGPIMQRGRIEVGAVGPHQRVNLWIYQTCRNNAGSRRGTYLAGEDRLEIEGPFQAVAAVLDQGVD